jgi:hypothetical protein
VTAITDVIESYAKQVCENLRNVHVETRCDEQRVHSITECGIDDADLIISPELPQIE